MPSIPDEPSRMSAQSTTSSAPLGMTLAGSRGGRMTQRTPSDFERSFKIRISLHDGLYRDRFEHLVDGKWFEMLITCTVLCNTVQMGLEADYPELEHLWVISENIATSIFSCEMVLKIIAKRQGYFLEKSNWLDAALTILGILDCWILALLPGSGADLQSLSVMRVLRLLRLARISKIARKMKAIVLLCAGLYRALETTFWVLVGLAIIMFVFAIFCTEYIGRPEAGIYPGFARDPEGIDGQELMSNYNPHLLFGSMSSSMLTLFSIAIGSEWSEIVRPLAIKQPIFVFVFLLYCILIVFGVMNVIVAIVVDNVLDESKKLDQELDKVAKSQKRSLLKQIQDVLGNLDRNQDGELRYKELKVAFDQNSAFQELLNHCDFPAGWTARELLSMLDSDGDGSLNNAEFTTNVFRLMDSGDFQQVCLLQSGINQVKYLVKKSHSKLEHQIKELKQAVLKSQPMQFSDGMPDTARNTLATTCATQAASVDANGPVRQHSPSILHLESDLFESLPKSNSSVMLSNSTASLASLGTTGRTSRQLPVELSLDRTLQQTRDLLERTEAIVKAGNSNAATENQHQLLLETGRKAGSLTSITEQQLLTQPPGIACPKTECAEAEHHIKRLSYNEFADILDAAFAEMRETLHRELSLPAQGDQTPFLSPSCTLVQASCVDQERASANHALDEKTCGLQAFRQISKLSEGVNRIFPSCSAAPGSRAPRTGEIVNVPTSL